MPTWALIVIILVVVAVAAAVATAAIRQRRTAALRDRFGPEYDRTVESHQGQRAAESELRERQRERAHLDIKPLSEASRVRYGEEWRVVQERFVDQPSEAVGSADRLLHTVMAERGYPMGDFAAQSDLISVDHPEVVENYRIAHASYERTGAGQVNTEELRDALLRYRTLFDEMLRADQGDARQDNPRHGDAGRGNVAVDASGSAQADEPQSVPEDGTDNIPDGRDVRAVSVPAQHTAGQTAVSSEADNDDH